METMRIGEIDVPVDVVKSRGKHIRMSYKDGRARISLPIRVTSQKLDEVKQQLFVWLLKLHQKKPHLFLLPQPSQFENQHIQILGQSYLLDYRINHKNNNILGKISGDTLEFTMPAQLIDDAETKASQLPKLLAKMFLSRVTNRVHTVNNQTLQTKFGKVSLRQANTRWGSCNQQDDLMFSTRLLLAPLPVIDHVIIHELAHTIKKDHSRGFWRIVATHDPQWRQHHHWLKINGNTLRY